MNVQSKRVGLGAAVALALVACGTSDDGGQGSAPPARLSFHPCDGFGQEALAAAGIDGSTPSRFEDKEIPFQSWACSYFSDDPYSGVLISAQGTPLSKVQNDNRLTHREDTEIGGHPASLDDFRGGLQCLVSVEIDPGVLEVNVGYQISDIETADQACALAMKVARDLASYFPEHL